VSGQHARVTDPPPAPAAGRPWAAPDRPAGLPLTRTPFGEPASPVARPSTLRRDAVAGLVTAVVSVLLGAPVGLLWPLVAPHAQVTVLGPGQAGYVNPEGKDFIGADGSFLLLGLVVGAVVGLLAWWLGRRHGPAMVLGLLAGGLLAAYVASRVGARVGREHVLAVVEAGRPATVRSSLRLLATESVVGWPVGALLGFAVPALVSKDDLS